MKSLCKTLLFIVMAALLGAGCARIKAVDFPNTPEKVMQGSWEACVDDGPSSSQIVELTYDNGQISEDISSFDQLGCTGTKTLQVSFTATVEFTSALGESSLYAGGTDLKLTPDVDLVGCGVGNPVYYFIQFSDDLNSFNPAMNEPKCDPSLVSNSLNTGMTFNRK